jgi:hypothetical protein
VSIRRVRRAAAIAVALLLAGGGAQAQDTTAVRDLPPAGYGTLGQEDVAITFQTGSFSIQVIPLDEWVLRLLSPDTYRSFHSLREMMEPRVQEVAARYGLRRPTLFLVTFFGQRDQARFEPDLLTITSQNRFFRPQEILPRSAQWNGRQLNQRETASAIYVFGDGIQLREPFTVSYDTFSSNRWEQVLRLLDRERARALARAADSQREP